MFRGSIRFMCRDGAIVLRMGHELVEGSPFEEERRVSATIAQVRSVLSISIPAVDRCFAAMRLPRVVLADFLSKKHVDNLYGAARLTPSAVEHLRATHAPMSVVFKIAALDRTEQDDAVEAWLRERLENIGGPRKPRRPARPNRFFTPRDAEWLEDLKNRVGPERVAEFLGLPLAEPTPKDD